MVHISCIGEGFAMSQGWWYGLNSRMVIHQTTNGRSLTTTIRMCSVYDTTLHYATQQQVKIHKLMNFPALVITLEFMRYICKSNQPYVIKYVIISTHINNFHSYAIGVQLYNLYYSKIILYIILFIYSDFLFSWYQ